MIFLTGEVLNCLIFYFDVGFGEMNYHAQ